jgi:hypothetical protein
MWVAFSLAAGVDTRILEYPQESGAASGGLKWCRRPPACAAGALLLQFLTALGKRRE